MEKDQIIKAIRKTLQSVMPAGGQAYLFGSQARGEARQESDWDILILMDKEKIRNEDFDQVAYPLIELGWGIGAEINPILYTLQDWERRSFTPFYKEVTNEYIILWH